MIESWDDVLTAEQFDNFMNEADRELRSLLRAFVAKNANKRIVLEYVNGCRLCFYPLLTAVEFNIGEPCLVVEDNFSRCGGGSLIKIKDDQSYKNNFFWAVQTFRLTPKFLREFALKLYEKVSE